MEIDWNWLNNAHSPITHNHTPHTLYDVGSDTLSSSIFPLTTFKNMYLSIIYIFISYFLCFQFWKSKHKNVVSHQSCFPRILFMHTRIIPENRIALFWLNILTVFRITLFFMINIYSLCWCIYSIVSILKTCRFSPIRAVSPQTSVCQTTLSSLLLFHHICVM